MSAFNILRAECLCSSCQKKYSAILQFKYGECWQHEYLIGQKIKWGANNIGIPNVQKAKVFGILENDICNACGEANNDNEFDILVQNDTIEKIEPLTNYEDYIEMDGCYQIIER